MLRRSGGRGGGGRYVGAERLFVLALHRVLLHSIAQAAERDAERLGGVRANAARSLEGLENESPFDLAEDGIEVAAFLREIEKRRCRASGRPAHLLREISQADERTTGQRNGAFDDVLELADVAGKRVGVERT